MSEQVAATPPSTTQAAGAPPAGTEVGNGGGVTPPAAQATDWTSSLSDEAKGFVQNKGWKEAGLAVESYRNLEKAIGVPPERLLKIPEKADDVQGWNAIYNRLGKPEKADGYKIEGDEGMVKFGRDAFFEANLSTKQVESIVGKWNAFVKGEQEAATKAREGKFKEADDALAREWGAAFEKNGQVAKKAAEKFGITEQEIQALESTIGFAATAKLFHKIGSTTGESEFVAGTGFNPNGPLTPQQAKYRLSELQKDSDFQGKVVKGDVQALHELKRLTAFANGREL